MSETAEIAVVLTTHNRAHLLPQVLEGLARQSLAPDRVELLVIDDGSTDGTEQVLAAWQHNLPMRVVRQKHGGLAAAKNLGIFMSRAPILLFLDDDDVAGPDLLRAHLAAHLNHPDLAVAVLGHTDVAAEIAAQPVMRHVAGAGGQLFSQGWMQAGATLSFREFWGGRSSAKRVLFTRFGVFNPLFRFGCEDIELGWRLQQKAGLRVIYEPAARTTMIRALSFDNFCERSRRQGRSQFLFARLHAAQAVQDYCEIETASDLWPRLRTHYAGVLRYARALDEMLQRGGAATAPIAAETEADLDAAYALAFQLCRFKGIADAAATAGLRGGTAIERSWPALGRDRAAAASPAWPAARPG